MFGVGRALWGSPSPIPCPSRVTQSRLHSTAARRGWNISREGSCFPTSALCSEATAKQPRRWGRTEAALPAEGAAVYLLPGGSVLFSQQSSCPPSPQSYSGQAEAESKAVRTHPLASTARGVAWVNRDDLTARKGTEHGRYRKQVCQTRGRLSSRAAGAPKGHVLIKTRQNPRNLVAQPTAGRAALSPQLP